MSWRALKERARARVIRNEGTGGRVQQAGVRHFPPPLALPGTPGEIERWVQGQCPAGAYIESLLCGSTTDSFGDAARRFLARTTAPTTTQVKTRTPIIMKRVAKQPASSSEAPLGPVVAERAVVSEAAVGIIVGRAVGDEVGSDPGLVCAAPKATIDVNSSRQETKSPAAIFDADEVKGRPVVGFLHEQATFRFVPRGGITMIRVRLRERCTRSGWVGRK